MNIVAPLEYIARPFAAFGGGTGPFAAAVPTGAGTSRNVDPLVWLGALATLIVVGLGAYVTIMGGPGDIDLSGLGIKVQTRTGGIAFLALGLLWYLALCRLLREPKADEPAAATPSGPQSDLAERLAAAAQKEEKPSGE